MKKIVMFWVTLSLLIGFLAGAYSKKDATLTVQPGPVKVQQGKTVSLWCKLKSDYETKMMPVHWQSPPNFRTRSGDCISFEEDKYVITCSNTSKTFTFFNLTIQDVQLEDEGTYRCVYTRHNGIVNLQVFVPVTDLTLTMSVMSDVLSIAKYPQFENEDFIAVLTCKTSCAFPAPKISWFEYDQPFEGKATETITESGCTGKKIGQKRTISKVTVQGTNTDKGIKEHNISCTTENIITEQTISRTIDINNGRSYIADYDATTSQTQPVLDTGSIVAVVVIPVLSIVLIVVLVVIVVRKVVRRNKKKNISKMRYECATVRLIDDEWTRPAFPSKCTFKLDTPQSESPHRHTERIKSPTKILPNVLAMIGETPLVKINKITKKEGLACEILAKCEFFNVSDNLKDRIALRMVEDAEHSKAIKPGDCLIGQNSGNRGVCLALVAAVKGYRCIIVMLENVSKEKENLMRSLGADVVRIPVDVDEQVAAHKLQKVEPKSYVMDPYRNPANPLAHYDGTAEEIIDSCDGKLDMLVTTVGMTGGLISGIARKIKKKCPDCKIIGVEPEGPAVVDLDKSNTKPITSVENPIQFDADESVSQVIVKQVEDVKTYVDETDGKLIDKWYRSRGRGFLMARRLIKEEGLLCGESSGKAMYVAVRAAKEYGLKAGQRVVVILPDSIRSHMSTVLSDNWMMDKGLIKIEDITKERWWDHKVQSLDLQPTLAVNKNVSIEKTINKLREKGYKQCPVVDDHGALLGMTTVRQMTVLVAQDYVKEHNNISSSILRQYKKVDESKTTLHQLSQLLDGSHFALVEFRKKKEGTVLTVDGEDKMEMLHGIATRLDLYHYIITNRKNEASNR